MEFTSERYDTHKEYRYNQPYSMPFPSSSSISNYFSDQAMKVGLSSGRFETREMILCELEKERIREEIVLKEINRKRILEAEVRRELMIERELAASMHSATRFPSSFIAGPPPSHNYEFESGMVYNQFFVPEDRRIEMPFHHRDFRGFEVVPFGRSPPRIQEIATMSPPKEDKQEVFIGLGMPHGSTRKSPPPPAPSDQRSNGSKNKRMEEFSCAICKVSTMSEHDFNKHLAGKKHLAKTAALRTRDTSTDSGVNKSTDSMKKRSLGAKKKSTKCVRKNVKQNLEPKRGSQRR